MAKKEIDYKPKIADGSITIREAFSAVLKKKLTPSNRESIEAVLKGLKKEGVDIDQNYFDNYDSKGFASTLDFSTNTTGTHRFKEFNAFESQFIGLVNNSGRNEPYKRLGDYQGAKGIASESYGLFGKQLRNADPMRGTITSQALDRIYHDALISPVQTQVDTVRGIDKPVIIDKEAADYLIYEKYTGQRAQSNIGPEGLKIADFNIFETEDGPVVEVRSKTLGNKTRPEATYTGEFAQFLKNKINQSKERVGPNADYEKVNLFQTTPDKVTALWKARIQPVLEDRFSSVLPEGKQGSHSVIRKILARQLRAEFKFSHDAVKSWMGHAGAGVDSSGDILVENYTGAIPDDRIGEMTNVLVRNDAFNNKTTDVNDLFISRGIGFEGSLTFPTPPKLVTSKTIDISQSNFTGQVETEGEKELRSATASSQAVEVEIGTEQRRQYLSEIRQPKAPVATDTDATPATPKEPFADISDLPVETQQKMIALGMTTQAEIDAELAAKGKGGGGGGGKGTAALFAGMAGAGIATADDAAAATAEMGRDILLDTAAEVGTRGLLRGVSRFVPGADALIPSGNMSPDQELEVDDEGNAIGKIKSQQEMERLTAQNAQRVKDEDAARIQRAREQQLMSRPIPGKSFLLDDKQL